MGSIPEQHIEELARATRKDVYARLAMLCIRRSEGKSEEEVAEAAKFGSPETMYRQLETWGLSGLVPPPGDPPEGPQPRTGTQEKSKARSGGGEGKELPPAAGATDIFQAAIWGLEEDLAYIQRHSEVLQGNDFVQTATTPGGDLLLRGRSPYPSWRLVRLIVAALMRANTQAEVEQLLRALRREPEKADLKAIAKLLTGEAGTGKRRRDEALKPIARKLAKLMRGGTLKPGRPVALNQYEHLVMDTIQQARQRGEEEDEIRRSVVAMLEETMPDERKLREGPDAAFARLSKITLPE